MMNIFIIEDEYWALAELQTLLKAYESNHSISYFENALSAVDALKKEKPDLVITDITMPGMSGLDFVSHVKKIDDQIECVLLTVHDTFDYAKSGIKLGVADYILKPIRKELLFETIDRVLVKIQEKQKDEENKQEWSIRNLLFKSSEHVDEEDQHLERQSLTIIYLLFKNWKTPPNINQQLLKSKVESFINRNDYYLSIDERRKLIILNHFQEDHSLRSLYKELASFSQIHIAIYNKSEKETLNHGFLKVHQMLEQHKHFGHSSFVNEQNQQEDPSLTPIWDIVRLLEKQLKAGQFGSAEQQIQQLMSKITLLKISQQQLFQFLIDMYYALALNLEKTMNIKIQFDVDLQLDSLNRLSTYAELEKWITNMLRNIESYIHIDDSAPKHLIPKIKKWIEYDYANSITFQQFAEDHHVSLSYLSQEFKRQTNCTFSEYLSQVRIGKAKKLFESGLTRTAEVGELVGYHDPKHFREVFKKMTGMTPKMYKEHIQSK
ncbi:response regulator [Halalkalibacter sp. AB-rgal2]|uniref:response regulator transcription factor n=1 Tax=Halalkalibacter sp. AB-rgal2 TaxID=3242695 RepID=UPI00359E02C5